MIPDSWKNDIPPPPPPTARTFIPSMSRYLPITPPSTKYTPHWVGWLICSWKGWKKSVPPTEGRPMRVPKSQIKYFFGVYFWACTTTRERGGGPDLRNIKGLFYTPPPSSLTLTRGENSRRYPKVEHKRDINNRKSFLKMSRDLNNPSPIWFT